MSKVITFSRVFPAYHPKKGQPTYFIEKIYAGIADSTTDFKIPNDANDYWDWYEYYNCVLPKHHTIRAGNRWKVGDKFSPRVWSGKPYNSKQIIIAPDIEIKKIWDIKVFDKSFFINGNFCNVDIMDSIIKNDGLSVDDFYDWFEKPLKDSKESIFQIICWNNEIDYLSLINEKNSN